MIKTSHFTCELGDLIKEKKQKTSYFLFFFSNVKNEFFFSSLQN